jgi:glyoxylase-like metal-dependent hydrolase (beta-lactamase superfamily II)
MDIHTFTLGSFGVSAYVVHAGHDAILVDAPEGSEAIVAFCKERRLVPRVLVNTHGHFDHIAANGLMKATWPELVIAAGKGDESMFSSAEANLSVMIGDAVMSPLPDRLLNQGDTVEVGDMVFEVLATPGHSPGGISLFSLVGPDARPVVFTGDALFAGSIGRTDFPGASGPRLIEAIRLRLLTLPPETVVYPGHGPPTTIGDETSHNPYL